MQAAESADNDAIASSLEKLIINNPDLEALESRLCEFNLFEAIGVIRQELKHSSLLAFLLSPNETHGLGDRFLKKLLVAAFLNVQTAPLSPVEIDIVNLIDAEVSREWRNIDLLIYSSSNKWVIAIENKVDSGEHSNQLKRYEDIVEKEFPHCKKRIFLYLTKDGNLASSKRWQQLSYSTVADTLKTIQTKSRSSIGNDVHTLISHYINLIRRHLVNDSDIAQLCRKIYKQHYQALDLIYEHRPDLQLQIADFLKEMVKEPQFSDIVLDDSNKFFIRCVPKSWDELSFQKTCDRWTSSQRLVLLEFFNYPDWLELRLTIGPNAKANKESVLKAVREAVLNTGKGLRASGFIRSRLNENGYSPIIKRTVLTKSDYREESWDSIQEKIREFWELLLSNEMKEISRSVLNIGVRCEQHDR